MCNIKILVIQKMIFNKSTLFQNSFNILLICWMSNMCNNASNYSRYVFNVLKGVEWVLCRLRDLNYVSDELTAVDLKV